MQSLESNRDLEHLHILSIFHFVVAGFVALFAMFPIIHLIIGIVIVSGGFENTDSGEVPPAFVGWMFVLIPAMFITFGSIMAFCIALAGRRLRRNTNYMYCLVIAAMECMFMPFGTALGVFTLIVLLRPTVQDLFGYKFEPPKSK